MDRSPCVTPRLGWGRASISQRDKKCHGFDDVSLLFCSNVPAFVASNFLVYLIPPASRAMNKEDQGFPGVDYVSSQGALIKIGTFILATAVVLGLIGAVLT
jgi:hypothetical protein